MLTSFVTSVKTLITKKEEARTSYQVTNPFPIERKKSNSFDSQDRFRPQCKYQNLFNNNSLAFDRKIMP